MLINRFAPANTAERGNRVRKLSRLLGIYQTPLEAPDDYMVYVSADALLLSWLASGKGGRAVVCSSNGS